MSAAEQAVKLFEAGVPVRDIGDMVGMARAAVEEVLTHSASRPRSSGTTTRIMRTCPFFDSCRDCVFQSCVLDRFREVSV